NDLLKEQQTVIKYDKPDHLFFLQKHPNLLDHIHESIEFKTADEKRKRKVVKVKTVNNFADNLRKHYNKYISRTTINNYLLLSQSNSIATKVHHHSAYIFSVVILQDDKAKVPLGISA
ncbi:19275_t:CDS:2, partial [Racocetra persica]